MCACGVHLTSKWQHFHCQGLTVDRFVYMYEPKVSNCVRQADSMSARVSENVVCRARLHVLVISGRLQEM